MITSNDNDKLKTIRKLHEKRGRERTGLFVAEGEDLVGAAAEHGWEPAFVLRAGEDVERELLDSVSTLGSGTRVLGVYHQRWSEPAGNLMVFLAAVADPGNVGTIIRSAQAFADGPVVLGPGCADPYSPKAVRASMGSLFARPPARAAFDDLPGTTIALEAHADELLEDVAAEPPVVLCFGSEREGMGAAAARTARIEMLPGPDSLNVAMAATVALYTRFRMARHA